MNVFRPVFALFLVLLLALPMAVGEEKKKDEAAKMREAALKQLSSSDWYVAAHALVFLAADKDKKVDEALRKAIKSGHPYLKMLACEVAAKRKAKDLIPDIAKAAVDSNFRAVVDSAAAALAALDEDAGMKALLAAWDSRTGRPAVNLARALFFFDKTDVFPTLSSILKIGDEEIAAYALITAAKRKEKKLEKQVLALKAANEPLQYCINEYLGTLEGSAAAEKYLLKQLSERGPNILMRAGASLAELDVQNTTAVLGHVAKRSNPAEAYAAIKALADKKAWKTSKAALKLASGKSDMEKLAACYILERTGDKKLAAAAAKLAKGKNSLRVKLAAMRALCALPDRKTALATVKSLLSSMKSDDRYTGLMGTAWLGDASFLPLVEKMFSAGVDARTAAAAGYAADVVDPAAGLEMFKRLLAKNNIKISTAVAVALRMLPYDASVDMLLSQLAVPDKAMQNVVKDSLELLTGCRFPPRLNDWTGWWKAVKEKLPETGRKRIVAAAPGGKKPAEGKDEKKDAEKKPVPVRLWYEPNAGFIATRAKRFEIVNALAGDTKGEAMVESGLLWLANFQDADGKWSASNYRVHARNPHELASGSGEEWDQAVTALALLAYMNAGYSPVSGPYSRVIRRGLDYLRSYMSVDGSIMEKSARVAGEMFEQAAVTLALVEAVLLGADEYREYAQRAVCFLCSQQTPKGGWGWKPDNFESANTSSTTWVAEAVLKAIPAGLEVLPGTKDGIWNWYVNEVSSPLTAYQLPHGEKMSQDEYDAKVTVKVETGWKDKSFLAGNTAMATWILALLGLDRDNPNIIGRLNSLAKYTPDQWNASGSDNHIYPHHYHLFLSRAKRIKGSKEYRDWYKGLVEFLDARMDKKGEAYGSWVPEGFDGMIGGRIFSTAMSVLSLETPYAVDVFKVNHVLRKAPKPKKKPEKETPK